MNKDTDFYNFEEFYKRAVEEMDVTLLQLTAYIRQYSPAELLSRISLIMHFAPKTYSGLAYTLRERPILYFLTALYLSNSDVGSETPSIEDVARVVDLAENYYTLYSQSSLYQVTSDKEQANISGIVGAARNLKIIDDINPESYPFQTYELTRGIFDPLDGYFLDEHGFTANDAIKFAAAIIARYERKLNEEADSLDTEPTESSEDILEKLIDSARQLFFFSFDEFCQEEQIEDIVRFRNYLETLSCEFGEDDSFCGLLDESIVFYKPIIGMSGKYFVPLMQFPLFNTPRIFEKLLESEKLANTKTWQRYKAIKSDFVETKVYEFLCRIFPPQNVYRNLHYRYENKYFEADVVVVFDNRAIVIETKAGILTPPAKRGAPDRLKSDLKKLVADANEQARRTREFIVSSHPATFVDKHGKEVLGLEYNPDLIDIFIANVTLEPLLSMVILPRDLQSLGIIQEDDYVWSVNLLEFDILTRHIPSPSVLIHYVEQRQMMQKDNRLQTMDEINLLGWYLEYGNFYTPLTEEGEKYDFVVASGWAESFDDYYLHGAEPPTMKIEPEIVEIIKFLEVKNSFTYTRVVSTLLNFRSDTKSSIAKHINEQIAQTMSDEKLHDFSILSSQSDTPTGFTFMVQKGQTDLTKRLAAFCEVKKYQTKAKHWIGIAADVSVDYPHIVDVLFLDYQWESDDELEEVISRLPLNNHDLQ